MRELWLQFFRIFAFRALAIGSLGPSWWRHRLVEGRESEKKGWSGTVHSLEGEDHACGSPVVRSSLHRFLKVPCVVRRALIGRARQGSLPSGCVCW